MISLKRLAQVHLGLLGLGTGVYYLSDKDGLMAFLLGWALVTINFVLLGTFWRRVLEKKPVAITMGLVVFKYAILIIVLYVFVVKWRIPLLPLGAGITTLGLSFLLASVMEKFR